MPIKPQRLRPGDTVAVVSPASPPAVPENIDRAVAMLESLGLRPQLGAHARRRRGFLAGTDRERAADLMHAFTDRRISAILCVRGGHGVTRLLPLLDYSLIRRHPKILVGYSDVTGLHCALRRRAGLVTFHGPMLNADFVTHRFPEFTANGFFRTLTQPLPPGSICQGGRIPAVRVVRGGVASGELVGGNLTVLCALVGTPWQPSFRGKILFIEDVNEPPYRYDRLLTHLLNAGLLRQVAGVAVGTNHGCEALAAHRSREFRPTLAGVLRDRLWPLGVPVVTDLPFGHVAGNATLPIGIPARLDGRGGDLVITAAAVT